MTRLIVLAGCVLVAIVGGAAAVRSPSYFPLASGNRWVLEHDQSSARQTITVSRSDARLVLRGFPGAGPLRVRSVGEAVQAWDASQRRWEAFLRLGAPAGTTYVVDLAETPLWRSVAVTVASRRAVVEDATGRTLRNCVRLVVRQRKPVFDAGIEELVFAPGIGPARIVEQTIAGPRALALVSWHVRGS